MPHEFTRPQIEQLEWKFQWAKREGKTRPPKSLAFRISLSLSKIGPPCSSAHVGRWFGARAREEDGLPRLTRKSPEQVAILEDSFSRDPYPSVEERARLIIATLLTREQVDGWFCYQRRNRPQELAQHGYVLGEQFWVDSDGAAAQPGGPGYDSHISQFVFRDAENERRRLLGEMPALERIDQDPQDEDLPAEG